MCYLYIKLIKYPLMRCLKMKVNKIPPKLQDWIDARKRYHLADVQIQMARELGLNPKKLDKIDNHKQESLGLFLPAFIEALYVKKFSKSQPDDIRSVEQIFEAGQQKKALKYAQKLEAKKTLTLLSDESKNK